MEADTCFTCSQSILKSTGKTQLGCGHTFHPHCIHRYYKGNSKCPACPSSNAPLLDFGDNVHIANATRELVYATAQVNANVQKSGLGWLAEKLRPKGNYPPLCGPDELVHWKAPISEFVSRGITAQNLAESGVKLDVWFTYGYTLADLQKLNVKWNDFVFMGFGPQHLKFVPASYLTDVLKVDITHLMQVGIDHTHLSRVGYSAKDLLALKCTTHAMINMGLQAEQMQTFNITENEWKLLALED